MVTAATLTASHRGHPNVMGGRPWGRAQQKHRFSLVATMLPRHLLHSVVLLAGVEIFFRSVTLAMRSWLNYSSHS